MSGVGPLQGEGGKELQKDPQSFPDASRPIFLDVLVNFLYPKPMACWFYTRVDDQYTYFMGASRAKQMLAVVEGK